MHGFHPRNEKNKADRNLQELHSLRIRVAAIYEIPVFIPEGLDEIHLRLRGFPCSLIFIPGHEEYGFTGYEVGDHPDRRKDT